MCFPFRIILDMSATSMNPYLWQVFDNWNKGHLFLGGNTSIGFGRFKLSDFKIFLLEMDEPETMLPFMLYHGFYGNTAEEIENIIGEPPLQWSEELKYKTDFPISNSQYKKIKYNFKIESPLLTKDPITAMKDNRNPDAVMIRKKVINSDRPIYMVKGESLKGIFRHLLMRNDPGNYRIFELNHEECDCLQCRLFGNVHQKGKLIFEDAEVQEPAQEKKMDHVAIDRFTGGGVDKLKYDDYPLAASPENPLDLKGAIWLRGDLEKSEQKAFQSMLSDFKNGLINLGGLNSIGYGRIKKDSLTLKHEISWLSLQESKQISINCNGKYKGEKPEMNFNDNHRYYPHYFLEPPERPVKRIFSPVSHVEKCNADKNQLHSGAITCKLKTLGPVFIADTEANYFNMPEYDQGKGNYHKNYGFFRINDTPAIPGSSLRGMISHIFETLTHSCFRIMDSGKKLSWRMKVDPELLKEFKPGRIIYDEKNKTYRMEELTGGIKTRRNREQFQDDRILPRVPVYEAPELLKNHNNITEASKKMRDNSDKIREQLATVFKDKDKKCRPIHEPPHGVDFIVTDFFNGNVDGYFQFTGFNKMEKKELASLDNENRPENIEKLPDKLTLPMHNNVRCDGTTSTYRGRDPKDKMVPYYAAEDGKFLYIVDKRCERIFLKKRNSSQTSREIPKSTIRRYKQLLEEYKANAKRNEIPKIFQTILSDPDKVEEGGLHGTLVFFRLANNKVKDIAPVRICRIVSEQPLVNKFHNKSLKPCTHICHDNCDECPETCKSVDEYFTPHPQGLCPACHLFGTPYYKGRVSFGIAELKTDTPNWLIFDNGKKGKGFTLPLLEKPRPTWSMPEEYSEIPGRKFYVHHSDTVEMLKKNQPNTGSSEELKISKNNRTIEALGKDNEFEFTVNYHNLRDWELGQLLYSLELEEGLAHKLGMAKAFGFGSVSISVTDLNILPEIGKTKLYIITEGLNKLSNNGADILDNLRKVLYFPAKGELKGRVCYPELESKNEKIPGFTDFVREKDPTTKEPNTYYMKAFT